MKIKRKITKFLEYLAIRPIIALLQAIPLTRRIRIAENISLALSLLMKKKIILIKKNIQSAFPDKPDDWIEDITHQNIRGMGRSMAEFLELPRMTEEKYNSEIIYQPSKEQTLEWFKDGGILILGHIGNWEWHGAMTARWIPGKIFAMAKRQSNPWSNRLFQNIRTGGGPITIFNDGSIFEPIRIIKNKNMVGFVADQDAGKNGQFFYFLNRQASTFTGPAVLARVTKAQVFFAYSYRVHEKLYAVIEKVSLPEVDPKKNPDRWDRLLTQTWVSKLEEIIKNHPVDYFWAHNRWKTQPKKENSH